VTQFDGLYENENGLLSVVARQTLQEDIGKIDPLPQPTPPPGSCDRSS